MEKNEDVGLFYWKSRIKKMLLLMKLICFWILVGLMQVHATAYGQAESVAFEKKSLTIDQVFSTITTQLKYDIFYSDDEIDVAKVVRLPNLTVNVEDVLRLVLGEHFTYQFVGKTIVIAPKTEIPQNQKGLQLRGFVSDTKKQPMPGVTVKLVGTSIGTATNMDGWFQLPDIPANAGTLEFSFVGYKSQKVDFTANTRDTLRIVMEEDVTEVDEVVVTGMFTRKANSFTGAAQSFSREEIRRVGNTNVLQSIKNLDPSFRIAESLANGSNPNQQYEITMRGQSGFPDLKGEYSSNPNNPLFIVDGFEQSLTYVMDMDMNRIESITILKDASAKALYGSKAANGVIVIETKRLAGNEQRITYNGSLSFEMPDLTSYDLCNALEKLEAERLDGVYRNANLDTQIELNQLYNTRKQMALQGLDTYWLAKPLHTGIGHKHNLNIEVGDSQSLRAVLDFTYNQITGVMKGSDRRNISGNANISYRRNNIIFRNIFSIISNNSNDSPYGSFSDYSKMNPYWQATDENGKVLRWAEYNDDLKVANPLYDATIGTSFTSSYLEFTNNFYTEWLFHPDWKATIRLGVSQKRNNSDDFYPAQHSMFATYTSQDEIIRRGQYIMENGKSSSLSGDFNINYNKMIKKHTIFANAGFFLSEDQYSAYQHTAEGFSNSSNADITFAKQYLAGTTPKGSSSINREASFLLAASYDYDNRYLADATIRESASSLYGSDNRWANSWSFGLGWNLHNEVFMKDISWIKQLKLRASVGLTGNQNFNTSAAIATYQYYSGITYGGTTNPMTGAYLNNLPNSKLKWEQKKDYNVGADIRVAGLTLKFDYYSADTKNMLTDVSIPTSTGFSSIKDNLGLVRNSGIELNANYTIWQGPEGFVNLYGTFVYNKNKIIRLSDSMRAYNEKMQKMAEEAKVAVRAVRRDGIDEAKTKQKNSEITEDELKNAENDIQKLTDKKIEEVDKILENKEKEIMSV